MPGRSSREAIRCLKRYLVALVAEQARLGAGRLGAFDVLQRFRSIVLGTGASGSVPGVA